MIQKTWNNTVYNIPQSGERGWATLTNFLTALADGAQTTGKQLIGRRTAVASPVTVTATTDCYIGVNVSLAAATVNLPVGVNGQVFIVADESGAGATYNITITPNGANTVDGGASFVMNQDKQVAYLVFNNGNWVVLHTGTSSAPITGVTDSTTIDFTLTAGNLTAVVKDDSITNAKVNSAAAIDYSKLNLSASLVNADVATGAAIAYAKLNLSNSIVNADINSAAAIAYSKLNLTGSIVNADINASAAIVYSKLVLTGAIVNADISASAAIAYSKLNLADSIVNADVNSAAAIAYSKLNLTGGVVNADVNASAAIAYSKLNLATSIVNADVAAAAAIARTKIANGTADHVVINNGSGTLSSEAQLAATRGGTGISSTATFPTSGVIVTEAATETLTNKTLSGAITSNYQQFTNSTVPATPASGSTRIYASSVDKKFHYVDDSGTDTVIGSGAGGSGGKNYLTDYSDFSLDPSTGMVTNLTATGNRTSSTTVWGANTTSLLSQTSTALRGTTSAQLVNGSSTSNFIESPMFTLDSIDVNTNQLFISFDSNSTGTSVASGDWLVQVIRYNSSGTFQENISPSITSLPSGYYNFKCAFSHSSTSTDQYALRFRSNTATARTLTIDTLIVGPQAIVDSAAVGSWIAYTPTYTGVGTVTNNVAYYRRVGDSMEVSASFTTGTPSAALFSVTLPSSLSLDTNKITINNANSSPGSLVGVISGNTLGNQAVLVTAPASSTSVVYMGNYLTATSGNTMNTPANGNTVFGSSTSVSLKFSLPISQWTSTVTLAGNANIEYASNSSSSDAADTTSFANGASGSAGIFNTTALTSQRAKRIQFQTPIQPTDRIQIEISSQSGVWGPLANAVVLSTVYYNFMADNMSVSTPSATSSAGMAFIPVSGSSSQLDVVFGRFAVNGTATGTTLAWNDSGFANYKWRVAKYSAVGLAELAPATATSQGTITRENVWTAYTPTASAGFGTATSVSAFYKVLGDSLFVRGSHTTGTPAGSLISISIPAGFTISSSKLSINNTNSNPGNIVGNSAISGVSQGQGFVITAPSSSTTLVYFGSNVAAGNTPNTPATGSATLAGTSVFSYQFEVPLV